MFLQKLKESFSPVQINSDYSIRNDPYKSWQKGSVENGNNFLREWLPREASISLMSQSKINHFFKKINRRPMKCLGYKTPEEKFINLTELSQPAFEKKYFNLIEISRR